MGHKPLSRYGVGTSLLNLIADNSHWADAQNVKSSGLTGVSYVPSSAGDRSPVFSIMSGTFPRSERTPLTLPPKHDARCPQHRLRQLRLERPRRSARRQRVDGGPEPVWPAPPPFRSGTPRDRDEP